MIHAVRFHLLTMMLSPLACALADAQHLMVKDVGASTQKDAIELRGLSAGSFDPTLWQSGKLHLVRDARSPLIEPKPGQFRNIYAPSIIKTAAGWTIFYGAWDGTPTGNDRIHRADTDPGFLAFTNRHTVIEHNVFQHVCNVNVARDDDGSLAMMCTAYPDAAGQNKPITFFSKDGEHWNGSTVPHAPTLDEIVTLTGYDKYKEADINGMNVLLRDEDKWRMYFADLKNFGKTFRATSDDGWHFKLDGKVLDGNFAINDMKKLKSRDGETWYLAGLHMNRDRIFYTLSRDPLQFPSPQTLITHANDSDRYIVAIGFVVDGGRVLGALYGAGAKGSLDQNRIFAVWLQKKVTIAANGKTLEATAALGPDRQLLKLDHPIRASIKLFSEDAQSPLGSADVQLEPGRAYELRSYSRAAEALGNLTSQTPPIPTSPANENSPPPSATRPNVTSPHPPAR